MVFANNRCYDFANSWNKNDNNSVTINSPRRTPSDLLHGFGID